MSDALLTLDDVRVTFRTPLGASRALRGVSLSVAPGSIVGLVGESGCGKTMTGKAILRLVPPNATISGKIVFDGRDLLAIPETEIRRIRGKRIAMIFQDPAAALNPVFTIGEQLTAIMRFHGVTGRKGTRDRAVELLAEVGLPRPTDMLSRYPHQLSGGMQQRAMIAMALSTSPDLLIADEPTTALDVTIQAQILELITTLRDTRGIAVLLITHNMAVVAQACQAVTVLYAGRVVEEGPVADVLGSPRHPYTQALLGALPTFSDRRQPLRAIGGVVPSGIDDIEGCVFASRCPQVMPICATQPPVIAVGTQDVSCWLYESKA